MMLITFQQHLKINYNITNYRTFCNCIHCELAPAVSLLMYAHCMLSFYRAAFLQGYRHKQEDEGVEKSATDRSRRAFVTMET